MIYLLAVISFWFAIILLLQTYFFYPLIIRLLAWGKPENKIIYETIDELPCVSILMAAYNEETVVEEKINSILKNNYPKEKIEILIGSDNSTDRTNEIVKRIATEHSLIKLTEFNSRTGKVAIINCLAEKAQHRILIITDANVIFDNDTITQLVKHFKNEKIALVDSNMINTGLKKDGISVQEKTYIQAEVVIKNAESKLWGNMMGPFGGCYALRKSYFQKVPEHFLVDDFYINMKALEQSGICINEKNAKVYEDVSNNAADEFRRKVRIATGSIQNLVAFRHLLNPFSKLGFSFLSHKVLRWIGPLLIIVAYASCWWLASYHVLYFCFLIIGTLIIISPLLDVFLRWGTVHFSPIRFCKHFITMNVALLIGIIKYSTGVKSSIWQPTKRNQ